MNYTINDAKRCAKPNLKTIRDGITKTSITALKTCPGANPKDVTSPCHVCYSLKFERMRPNVMKSHEAGFKFTKSAQFVELMSLYFVQTKQYLHRWHSDGDIYSAEYRDKLIQIARNCPDTKFYCYTKSSHLMVNIELPENFRVIYSLGGKYDHLVDVSTMRHAKMFYSLDALLAAGYVDASESDLVAASTESLKIGLIKH